MLLYMYVCMLCVCARILYKYILRCESMVYK